jgi:hypothetical protein
MERSAILRVSWLRNPDIAPDPYWIENEAPAAQNISIRDL